jgi:hypothetical protein
MTKRIFNCPNCSTVLDKDGKCKRCGWGIKEFDIDVEYSAPDLCDIFLSRKTPDSKLIITIGFDENGQRQANYKVQTTDSVDVYLKKGDQK